MDDLGYPSVIKWFNDMIDNNGPPTDRDSIYNKTSLLTLFAPRDPKAVVGNNRPRTPRDDVAWRVEKYIVTAAYGPICEQRKIKLPYTFAKVPVDVKQNITPWVETLLRTLAVSHQPDHAHGKDAVEGAVGEVSVRLHGSSVGRGKGPVRDLKNKVLQDVRDCSRERSRSVSRVAASSAGTASSTEPAAPAVEDDDMQPISYQHAVANAVFPPEEDETPSLESDVELH